MTVGSNVGAWVRFSAVLLALVALSPMPLALPSGIALAAVGLTGAVMLLLASAAASSAGAHGAPRELTVPVREAGGAGRRAVDLDEAHRSRAGRVPRGLRRLAVTRGSRGA